MLQLMRVSEAKIQSSEPLKWVLFENVSGIVNFEKGKVIEIMNAELGKYGYLCVWDIINAADYGVPQIRKRFFLMVVNVKQFSQYHGKDISQYLGK